MEPHPEEPRSGVSKGEAGNCRHLTRSSMQFGTRAGAALVDDAALAEAVQREGGVQRVRRVVRDGMGEAPAGGRRRSEEHTSELQSLMRISYAVFCLKKKKKKNKIMTHDYQREIK